MNTKIKLILHSDHLLIRAGMHAVLVEEGDIELVAHTENSDELLNQVTQLCPDVLLLGVATGDVAAQQLIRQIKAQAPETVILVMSMCCNEQYAAACARAGANVFMSKCSAASDLHDIIRRLAKGASGSHDLVKTPAPRLADMDTSGEADVTLAGDTQKLESQSMLAPLSWAMDELAHELNYLTAHDALTGLVNRQEFESRLKSAVKEGKITGTEHSLLYLDLDQFKLINDTCGHVAGDEYLRQISDLLNRHSRISDTLARLGGDEFALLLYGCAAEPALRLAELLRQMISELEFNCGHRKFGGGVSIGAVTFAEDALNWEQVLSRADSACFMAKEKGRNRVHVYRADDAELSVRLQEMDWVSRLREALEHQRLKLYAQDIAPITGLDEEHTRLEILVRLQEADGTIIPPTAFIGAAERYNLMPTLDRYIISAAFRHLAGLPGHQREHSCYSINISGATLNDEEFTVFVEQQLTEHGLSANRVCFEITETTAIANLLQTADVIRTLRVMGFQFALDDFGKGMSSLAYLKHLPVDFIKIDGEFVRGILHDEIDGAVVRAIADIAHTMGIKTVAEFVESDAVLDLLENMGIDFVQGYGIHEPEPLDERLISLAEPRAVAEAHR